MHIQANSGKPRLLAIGQAVKPTGYARVLHSIVPHLHPEFEVLLFGVNYTGKPLNHGYRIRPNQLIGDILGREQLPEILKQFQPDLILMCHDPGFYDVHHTVLTEYRRQHLTAKVIYYCPIEWAEVMPGIIRTLLGVDHLVFYTEFGKKVAERAFEDVDDLQVPPITVLPHGIDTRLFYPLAADDRILARQQARTRLFPDQPLLKDAFIVLNANRNCPRKRIDLTMRAFARFVQDKPANVVLYLHMGMRDTGYDILKLAKELNILHRLLLTTTAPEKPDISDDKLNLIYNACDVGMNTSTGEGWGLVAFEHAATGAAQIVPRHSACAELWQNNGLLIPLDETPEEIGRISLQGAVDALNRFYNHRQLLQNLSNKALHYATLPRFQWHHIAHQWKSLFSKYLPNHSMVLEKIHKDK
ncbi:MAG: glycosyltransferase [Candidatus Aminicenantes bacterium]